MIFEFIYGQFNGIFKVSSFMIYKLSVGQTVFKDNMISGEITEYARKAFYYMGAKLFNSLPLKARSLQNTCEFKNFVSDLFK